MFEYDSVRKIPKRKTKMNSDWNNRLGQKEGRTHDDNGMKDFLQDRDRLKGLVVR
jgi:hypothetical protein